LKTVTAHVQQLARDRGLEDAFLGPLSSLDAATRQAVESDSKEMVEAALGEVRSLARQLAATQAVVDRLPESGAVPAQERPSTLLAASETGSDPGASEAAHQPSDDGLSARDSLLL